MDLFYLNGSLLFLLLNYRWNILFSQKNEKDQFNWGKKKKKKKDTIHSFADSVLLGLFSLLFLFNGL